MNMRFLGATLAVVLCTFATDGEASKNTILRELDTYVLDPCVFQYGFRLGASDEYSHLSAAEQVSYAKQFRAVVKKMILEDDFIGKMGRRDRKTRMSTYGRLKQPVSS